MTLGELGGDALDRAPDAERLHYATANRSIRPTPVPGIIAKEFRDPEPWVARQRDVGIRIVHDQRAMFDDRPVVEIIDEEGSSNAV